MKTAMSNPKGDPDHRKDMRIHDHASRRQRAQTPLEPPTSPLPPPSIGRGRKFLSYYRPHLGLLAADLACAVLVSATALALPLLANYWSSASRDRRRRRT